MKNIAVYYYLQYSNEIYLNLNLKIVQKTSHNLKIHIYTGIFKNRVIS